MPNPYDDLFNNGDENQKDPQDRPLDLTDSELGEKDNFKTDGKEPLDEIVENIQRFDKEAEAFAKLLSRTKAIDHKVMTSVERILFMELKPKEELTLIEEREYHHLLRKKFEAIINPMRNLAKIHLEVVQQYNTDIDAEYFSTEKTDHTVNSEKSSVVNNINIQRKILADASDDLTILKDALEDCEKRIGKYINAGGNNNISRAEHEIIVQKRIPLTNGKDHQFDFSVFDINLLDKTAISLGLYMQETSSQYFGKLMKAFGTL